MRASVEVSADVEVRSVGDLERRHAEGVAGAEEPVDHDGGVFARQGATLLGTHAHRDVPDVRRARDRTPGVMTEPVRGPSKAHGPQSNGLRSPQDDEVVPGDAAQRVRLESAPPEWPFAV